MAQAKKPTTAKSPISSMGLTFESGNPANYPIAYGDNVWDIAQQNTELADKLGGVGQYDQHTINEVFAGGISKIAETIQSLAQLPANPKKGDTYRIREATTQLMREYADSVVSLEGWRLFTADEANYIGVTRPNAAMLQSVAVVNNVMGLLLLPDDWSWQADERLKYYDGSFAPATTYFDEVTFNESEWAVMEQYGAVFLPISYIYYTDGGGGVQWRVPRADKKYGNYTSSTRTGNVAQKITWQITFEAAPADDNKWRKTQLMFKNDWATTFASTSIRLVKEVEQGTVGAFATPTGTFIQFAQGNLQFKPSIRRFRFAPTQYSAIDNDQINAFLAKHNVNLLTNNADVWVDRFVIGATGGNPMDIFDRVDYLVEKQVIYPAGSLIQYNGTTWQWLNGYQNGNLLSNDEFNKLKNISQAAISGSYNDLTDKPTKVSTFENDALYAQRVQPVAMDGYKQLAYIVSDKAQNQYIDTNIKPNQNTGFEIDFSTPDAPNTQAGQPNIFNAGGKVATSARFGLCLYKTKPGGEFTVNTNKTAIDPKLVADKRLVLKYQNRVFSYTDGTTAEMPDTGEFETANTLLLFAGNNDGGIAQFASVRLYSFKVYDGTTLQAHFVPAQRLGDNVIGLYEAVSGTFFENLGEGAFTGADIDTILNRASQLINDINLVSDSKYVHSDNNFSNTYKSYVDNFNSTYKGKVDANGAAIEVLNGDENTTGSVQNTVLAKIAEVVAEAPASLDTLKEIADWIADHASDAAAMNTAIQSKVKQYVFVCKNYAEATSKTIEAATHGCGALPVVTCYSNNKVVSVDIQKNAAGDIAVSWNDAASVTPANPLTICIMGVGVTPVEEQEPAPNND